MAYRADRRSNSAPNNDGFHRPMLGEEENGDNPLCDGGDADDAVTEVVAEKADQRPAAASAKDITLPANGSRLSPSRNSGARPFTPLHISV